MQKKRKKNYRKMTTKKNTHEQNKAKKQKQKHTRVRVVELREKVVFTSLIEIKKKTKKIYLRFAFTLFYTR